MSDNDRASSSSSNYNRLEKFRRKMETESIATTATTTPITEEAAAATATTTTTTTATAKAAGGASVPAEDSLSSWQAKTAAATTTMAGVTNGSRVDRAEQFRTKMNQFSDDASSSAAAEAKPLPPAAAATTIATTTAATTNDSRVDRAEQFRTKMNQFSNDASSSAAAATTEPEAASEGDGGDTRASASATNRTTANTPIDQFRRKAEQYADNNGTSQHIDFGRGENPPSRTREEGRLFESRQRKYEAKMQGEASVDSVSDVSNLQPGAVSEPSPLQRAYEEGRIPLEVYEQEVEALQRARDRIRPVGQEAPTVIEAQVVESGMELIDEEGHSSDEGGDDELNQGEWGEGMEDAEVNAAQIAETSEIAFVKKDVVEKFLGVKKKKAKIIGFGILSIAGIALAVGLSMGLRDVPPPVVPTMPPLDWANEFLPEYTRLAIFAADHDDNIDSDSSSSSQAKAYQWSEQDAGFLETSESNRLVRFALATLYYATSGSEWLIDAYWLDQLLPECLWFGAICGDTDDDEDVVRYLALVNNNLLGSLPAEIGLCQEFFGIALQMNDFTGSTIPTQIGDLHAKLQDLNMKESHVGGTIPTNFANLTNLQTLDLSSNELAGTIPTELGMMNHLYYLSLSGNQLRGTIPKEVTMLPNMRQLLLADNVLMGTVPTEFTVDRSQNNTVVLSNFTFSFTNTSNITNATNTTIVAAPRHIFDDGFGYTNIIESTNVSGIQFLDVANNSFTGTIPSEIIALNRSLVSLRLAFNNLNGTIPTFLGLLSNINGLDLANNDFTGTLSSELATLWDDIRYFSVSNNQLSGTIPTAIFGAAIKNGHTLLFDNNGFSGTIPTLIGILTNIHTMRFGQNKGMGGSLPTELGLLTEIHTFDAHSCSIDGSIPTEVGLLTEIRVLDLSQNSLIGALPSELGLLRKLQVMNLQKNSFTSSMPTELCNLFHGGELQEINVDCLSIQCVEDCPCRCWGL